MCLPSKETADNFVYWILALAVLTVKIVITLPLFKVEAEAKLEAKITVIAAKVKIFFMIVVVDCLTKVGYHEAEPNSQTLQMLLKVTFCMFCPVKDTKKSLKIYLTYL
jgi:hypothetical protein